MIRLVDDSLMTDFLGYCADKPFGIRMAAALQSYGTQCSFADFWLVLDECAIVGAISKLDSDVTVCAEGGFEEISAFIGTVGYSTLMGERALISALGFERFSSEGAIMQYMGGRADAPVLGVGKSPSVMEACKILRQCEGESIKTGDFDRFYTDLSLRVRRGTAVCYELYGKGVAIASAVTDSGAIIGGVAVMPDARKKGIGSALVRTLLSDLSGYNKIYLLRLNNENESFYKGLSFDNVGSWASISRGCE